jgi:hypothetical protein
LIRYKPEDKKRIEYYKINRDSILDKSSIYRDENQEKIKKYRSENKEKIKKYNKSYKEENREKNREKINLYYRERKKNDQFFKFKSSVRNLIYNSFKRCFSKKSKRTIEILCCTFEEFKIHIESKFNENMSWDNYGYFWEFDHIIQLATANTYDEIIKLNHYTNFQPLEIKLNRSKNFKFNN